MMKMKVLICGSAGFLMSNLLRYMLYRDEDRQYEFASVDVLPTPEDYERIYIHRKHRFYVGDARDQEFLRRIVHIEKPRFVVNGVGVLRNSLDSARNIVGSACAIHAACPDATVIQIAPRQEMRGLGPQERAYWELAGRMSTERGGVDLRIPRCFGIRDRHGAVVGMLKRMLAGGDFAFSDIPEPWSYAEDVASMIWYIMENGFSGQMLRMPALGVASHLRMAGTINKALDLRKEIPSSSSGYSEEELLDHLKSGFLWKPDSENVEQALMKTAQWFNINRWALEQVD